MSDFGVSLPEETQANDPVYSTFETPSTQNASGLTTPSDLTDDDTGTGVGFNVGDSIELVPGEAVAGVRVYKSTNASNQEFVFRDKQSGDELARYTVTPDGWVESPFYGGTTRAVVMEAVDPGAIREVDLERVATGSHTHSI